MVGHHGSAITQIGNYLPSRTLGISADSLPRAWEFAPQFQARGRYELGLVDTIGLFAL